jgi:hypothetical protein
LQVGDVDFTACGWINMASKAGTNRPLFGKYSATLGSREWVIDYLNSNDRVRVIAIGNGVATTTVTASTFGSPPLSTWFFVVFWHDSIANTINIQINNWTPNSAAHTTGIFAGTAPFEIGRVDFGSLSYFSGIVDEVGIWKRVLTTDERTALWNAGNGLSYDAFGGGSAAAVHFFTFGF